MQGFMFEKKDHCRAGHGVVQVLIGSFQSSSSIKECDDQKTAEVNTYVFLYNSKSREPRRTEWWSGFIMKPET